MSLFSSNTPVAAPSARRLAWYGLFLVGAMIALWAGAQAVAMPSAEPGPAPETADSVAVASSPAAGDAPEIEVFTWGNLAAFLLLAGGGGAALYLHQQKGRAEPPSPFQRLGRLGLGPSKHVQLVACGGEVLLLSVTEDEITLLKTYAPDAFEDGEEIDPDGTGPPAAGEAATPPTGEWPERFADVLNRFADRAPHS